MTTNEFRHSKSANFVRGLGIIRVRRHNVKNIEHYSTTYNGVNSYHQFKKNLFQQSSELEKELQDLPLNYSGRENRIDFLNVIHRISTEAESYLLEFKNKNVLNSRFPFQVFKNTRYFPKSFDNKVHECKVNYENHKIHAMFQLHREITHKTVKRIEVYKNDSMPEVRVLSSPQSRNENINKEIVKRFKTKLSVTQLAYLFGLVTEIVVDKKPNKKELAKILSELFETSRAKVPSEQQLYKSFFDVEDTTKEAVRGMLIEMLNRVNGR